MATDSPVAEVTAAPQSRSNGFRGLAGNQSKLLKVGGERETLNNDDWSSMDIKMVINLTLIDLWPPVDKTISTPTGGLSECHYLYHYTN